MSDDTQCKYYKYTIGIVIYSIILRVIGIHWELAGKIFKAVKYSEVEKFFGIFQMKIVGCVRLQVNKDVMIF